MKTINLHSYAYFGTKQFPVDIPIICDSTLFNLVHEHENDYERNYQNLHESSPNNIFKRNFNGLDVWGAISKATQKIILMSDDSTADIGIINEVCSLLNINYTMLRTDNTYTPTSNTFTKADRLRPTGGVDDYPSSGTNVLQGYYCGGRVQYADNTPIVNRFYGDDFLSGRIIAYLTSNYLHFWFYIYPDDVILNDSFNPVYANTQSMVEIQGDIYWNNDINEITRIYINNISTLSPINLQTFLNGISIPFEDIHIDDIENPYGEDGTSTTGGGDGDLPAGSEGLDFIDPTDIPDLPSLSGVATGFITMYNPTSGQLSSLGQFLWSGMFDLDTYKKLFADPMQGIIGLGIVPVVPNFAGSRNIMFGNVDTGVNCSYLSSQYAKKDCGAVNIQKYVGSFMDYSPYVKISLFLPYIGFVNLGTDDIMGGSINVTYNVDVLTGDCVAFIKHNTKGVLYAYHGNCLTNVPVSGQNYANALKNYYESVAGVIPATTNGATGGPAGAIGGAIAGTLQSASNVILNSKPTFQRSGNIGGSAGIMGIQKPFIVIERPNISVPNNVQHYAGQTSNITMNLGACTGLTIVDSVHLNGISATSQELKEIESLLKVGVIL